MKTMNKHDPQALATVYSTIFAAVYSAERAQEVSEERATPRATRVAQDALSHFKRIRDR